MSESVVVRDPITLEGARVLSPDISFTPERGIAITPQRAGNPQGIRSAVIVALNHDQSRTWSDLTTTTLGVGGSFTSSSQDYLNYPSAGLFIRSDQPVSVEIQESFDGSTFATSYVYYLGLGAGVVFHGVIFFNLAHRYWRVIVTNIGDASQTTFRVARTTYAIPILPQVLPTRAILQRTTSPLGANASWTSRTLFTTNIKKLIVTVFADQAGTLFIDESPDGITWRTTRSISVTGNTVTTLEHSAFAYRLARIRYVNGATTQSIFDLQLSVENMVM